MPLGAFGPAFPLGTNARVELLGRGTFACRKNFNAKVSLPPGAPFFPGSAQTALGGLQMHDFCILCSFSSFSQQEHSPATSYSLIQEAKMYS